MERPILSGKQEVLKYWQVLCPSAPETSRWHSHLPTLNHLPITGGCCAHGPFSTTFLGGSRDSPKVAQQVYDRACMRIQMCGLCPMWLPPHPSPTDLSARSRVRPEKSKKLRYSPATSLLNSLLSGEHRVFVRSRTHPPTGSTWAVSLGGPRATHPSCPSLGCLPLPASWAMTVHPWVGGGQEGFLKEMRSL